MGEPFGDPLDDFEAMFVFDEFYRNEETKKNLFDLQTPELD